jgi:SAM-dependent methyltransferase
MFIASEPVLVRFVRFTVCGNLSYSSLYGHSLRAVAALLSLRTIMADETQLYTKLAAAYVRGRLVEEMPPAEIDALCAAPLDELTDTQRDRLIAYGRERELRLHRFKRTMGLARVSKVLGALRGLAPAELLDIGSGRGAFLWPLLDAFPWLQVTAVDMLEHRVAGLQAVATGGIGRLTALQADATSLPFEDMTFDVVTMLEVLEHIHDTEAALRETLRVARRFLVLSVPSRPDNNPEHIHLFDAGRLERLLLAAGAARVSFDSVPGHLIAIARRGP